MLNLAIAPAGGPGGLGGTGDSGGSGGPGGPGGPGGSRSDISLDESEVDESGSGLGCFPFAGLSGNPPGVAPNGNVVLVSPDVLAYSSSASNCFANSSESVVSAGFFFFLDLPSSFLGIVLPDLVSKKFSIFYTSLAVQMSDLVFRYLVVELKKCNVFLPR
jgi:hypothetical protein